MITKRLASLLIADVTRKRHRQADMAETSPHRNSDLRFSVVSLFSGCGGLDLGFRGGFDSLGRHYERLPFEVVWANDFNAAAVRTYRLNLSPNITCGDVWEELATLPPRADVVAGGFPCQDISVNGKRKGLAGARSGLYRAMVTAVKRLSPRIFVAENVKGLLMRYNEGALATVLADFSALGYDVSYRLYRAADYGVPQVRERVFIVGTSVRSGRFDPPMPVLDESLWISAREAIGDLEALPEDPDWNHVWSRANRSPEQGDRRLRPDRPGYTIRAECHGNIQFHYSLPRRISMREAARIQSFPDDFIFDARLRETERQVGNAVPPVLGWHVARAVAASLKGDQAKGAMGNGRVPSTESSRLQADQLSLTI
jgi:DNA (cytosine-5)-methyltransferase 1